MILIANPLKLFTYTAKNTVRHRAIINDYKEQIHSSYNTIEESTQTDIAPPQLHPP